MSKQQSVTQKQQMFVECLSQFIRTTKYSIVDGYYKTHETVNGFIGCKDEIAAHHSGFIEPYLDTYKTARASYLPRSLCPPPAPAAGPLRVSGEPEVRCFLTIFSPPWNISRRVSTRVSRGGASLLCPQLTALHKEEDPRERHQGPPLPQILSPSQSGFR